MLTFKALSRIERACGIVFRPRSLLIVGLSMLTAGGCASRPPSSAVHPNTSAASSLSDRAATLLAEPAAANAADRISRAESLLQGAIEADPFYGPAHNNLGTLRLQQGRLSLAATSFDRARALLPNDPAPRVNLAIVLERAGRLSEARDEYGAALATDEAHLAALQGRTRLDLALGQVSDDTQRALAKIAEQGTTDAWRRWATMQLTKRSAP